MTNRAPISTFRDFTNTDQERLDKILIYFIGHMSYYAQQFPQYDQLLNRLKKACETVAERGWSQWVDLETTLNEVCVALGILEYSNFEVNTLFYEPKNGNDRRTIDFVMIDRDGSNWLIDVKTIIPERQDRWAQYELASEGQWLTPNNYVVLDQRWLGGEIWHNRVTSRARMLEHTLEFEDKISNGIPNFDPTKAIMVFCSNGYHWTEDQLEDFVFFYQEGSHRPDDPLGSMEDHHIQGKKLTLPRRIKRFAYLERGGLAYEPTQMNWNVSSGPQLGIIGNQISIL